MRFYTFFSILFLLSGLVILGCGGDAEDNNANVLDPQNGLEGENSPIVNSLIPRDEIPVITIEKTREDAENIWWRLKAAPAPSHGDLVVGLDREDWALSGDAAYSTMYVAILNFENTSMEIKYDKAKGSGSREIMRLNTTINYALNRFTDDGIGALDLPPFQLDDGYVVPQGFQFSYYLVGEPSELRLVPGE